MDLYSVVKFLHVAAAVCWVGGGVTLCALGIMASSRRDDIAMLGVLNSVGTLANLWFVPASLATLLFGLVVAWLGNLWTDAWIILGLVGFFVTALTGHFVLRPFALRIKTLAEVGSLAEAAGEGRRLLGIARFDYVLLFMIIADMVLKPGWGDVATLGTIAAVIGLAAVLFLLPAFHRSEPASA